MMFRKKYDEKPDPRKKLIQPEKMLIINSSPHLHTSKSVPKIMWSVIVALIPAMAMSIYYFGLPAVWMISTCVLTAIGTEIVNELHEK